MAAENIGATTLPSRASINFLNSGSASILLGFPILKLSSDDLVWVAYQHQSGDFQYFRNSGSNEARTQLLLWCRQCIVYPKRRPTTPVGKELGAKYDELLAKYFSDGNLGKIKAIEKYFDKQIEAIALESKILWLKPPIVQHFYKLRLLN